MTETHSMPFSCLLKVPKNSKYPYVNVSVTRFFEKIGSESGSPLNLSTILVKRKQRKGLTNVQDPTVRTLAQFDSKADLHYPSIVFHHHLMSTSSTTNSPVSPILLNPVRQNTMKIPIISRIDGRKLTLFFLISENR